MTRRRSAHLRGSADSRMIELDYSVISQYADRQISSLEQSIYKVLITGEFIEVNSYQFPIRLHISRSKIAKRKNDNEIASEVQDGRYKLFNKILPAYSS